MGTGARPEAAGARLSGARRAPRGSLGFAALRRNTLTKTATPDQGGRYNLIGNALLPRNKLAQNALVNGVRFVPVGQQWRVYKERIREIG